MLRNVKPVVRPLLAVLATLGTVLAASARADSTGPASWDPERARSMFKTSVPADTVGLEPAWSLAVRDSGRRAEVVTNHFRGSTSSARFPLDRVELRRMIVRGSHATAEELAMEGGFAVVPIREDGGLVSPEIHWTQPEAVTRNEPPQFAGVGPIPRDGHHRLSSDGRFLLVLRGRAINIRGETGSFGLLGFFDVSDPKRPRRIGTTLEADGPFHNGVVADDGSRVAVEILLPAREGWWLGSKVVAFERRGKSLSAPRIVVARAMATGLQFEGPFLFVGMQRPPLPVCVEISTTVTLDLYDLR